MSAAFTAGPWVSTYHPPEPFERTYSGPTIMGADGSQMVAETLAVVDDMEANARLIAAAPDMFEALEEVRSCGNAGAKLSRAASDKVKAALRKARGEA